jgi:type III restriction enzyme
MLSRKRLDVIPDASVPAGYRLVPSDAAGAIVASAPQLPSGGAAKALQDAICDFDIVEATRENLGAARRLASDVITGAGSEEALAPYLNATIAAVRKIVTDQYRHSPEVVELLVVDQTWGPTRLNTRSEEPNRFGKFSRRLAYSGWTRGLYELEWFDSAPERAFANLVDSESGVAVWTRIQRSELTVEWEGGRYSPDFYVDFHGTHYLVEVKADKDLEDQLVQDKKAAAERWARQVTDSGEHGPWQYLLVGETVLRVAKTFQAVLTHLGFK